MQLASGSDDSTIKLWDMTTGGTLLQTLEGHSKRVNTVAFSSDGMQLASGSEDSTIKLWDMTTGGTLLQTLESQSDWVLAVAFSPDGRHLASGSLDKTIRLWDMATGGTLLQTLKGHLNCVTTVAFSPDGQHLASGSDDETIRLWNVATGLQTLKVDVWVDSLAFSMDGSCLETVEGLLPISSGSTFDRSSLPRTLFVKGRWVARGMENLLWLPSGYRPACIAVHKNILVFGYNSGSLSMCEFTF
jgi:WD40 repeat protein